MAFLRPTSSHGAVGEDRNSSEVHNHAEVATKFRPRHVAAIQTFDRAMQMITFSRPGQPSTNDRPFGIVPVMGYGV